MKVQLFASTALMLLSTIPGALSAEHLHPKEAVAATAADFEDDFEEKSPSAKSFSLRGAVAAAASVEDAADDEEEELEQYGNWKNKIKKYEYKWKKPKDWGAKWQGKHCYKIHVSGCPTKDYQGWKAQCKVRNNKCVPKNFEDEEFDSQDLEMFDAPEDAADEDEELIQWQNHAKKWQNKNWDEDWKKHAKNWQNTNWSNEWKKHANCDWVNDWEKCSRKYHGTGHGGINPHTGKPYGSEWQNGEHCYKIHVTGCPTEDYQGWKALCKVRNNKCVPRNFEDEEFDSQDLEMFDAPEDAADEDEELIQWQNHAKKWQNKNWDEDWKKHAKNWQNTNWSNEWKKHANCDWVNDWEKCSRKYHGTGHGGINPHTGKPYGSEWQNGEHCYKIHVSGCPTEDYQGWKALCKVRNNKCVPRN